MNKEGIAGKMNEWKESSGLSIAQMARDLDVDPSSLGNILRGNRGVPVDMVAKFVEAYPDVSAEWLLRDEGPMLKSDASSVVNHQSNVDGNTTVGGNSGMSEEFVAHLMEEKDKQINQLLQIIQNK
jgi:transcriptional regulator with XRE-family HTH domain